MGVNLSDAVAIPSDITPAAVELSTDAERALESARSYIIDCPEMRVVAGEELISIKGRVKAITEERLKITRPIDESKKRVMDFFRRPLAALEEAEKEIKRSILAYDRQVEEARRKEEARLAAEAAKKQAEIDRRAAAKAAKIKAEAEAKAAAAASEAEKQAILDAAEDKAEAVVEDRKHVHVPVVAAPQAKVGGVSTTKRWGVSREPGDVDIVALARAVADGKAPPNLLTANFKDADALARALKENFNIPGLKAVCTETISARSS